MISIFKIQLMVVKNRLYYTKMSPLIKLNDVKGAPAGTTTHTRPFMSSRDHGQRNKGRHLCLVSNHPMFPLASLWVKVDGSALMIVDGNYGDVKLKIRWICGMIHSLTVECLLVELHL